MTTLLRIAAMLLLLAFTSHVDARSYAAKAQFARLHPCPATHKPVPHCPGYVIDHIKALACGGPDKASNMQWQTIAAGKAKDKWERKGCQGTKP